MSKHYGSNVTKLIIKFIAREAIPLGGSLADGVEFIRNPERRKKVLEIAEAKAIQAIQLIKSAPDNPFGNDDEQIASELLKRIEERRSCPSSPTHRHYFDDERGICLYCGIPSHQ